jgi:hypothetical protein
MPHLHRLITMEIIDPSSTQEPQLRMRRLLRPLERISLIIVVLVPVLAVVCIAARWWDFLQNVIPFPLYMQFKTNLTLSLVCGSVLFFFALMGLGLSIPYSKKLISRSILLVIGVLIGIPMFCIFGFSAVSPDLLIGSAKLGNNHYYVTVPTEFGDMWVDHWLHKCNEKDMECKIIFKEVLGGSQIYPASFFVDNHTHEIHFFLGRWLEYTDGPYPHGYKSIQVGVIDSSQFHLLTYEKKSLNEFVITKCDGKYLDDKLSCAVLPFQYASKTFDKAELVMDVSAREIKLLIDDKIIFSYDTTPHCHTEGCVITE